MEWWGLSVGVLSAHWLSAIENALIALSDSPQFYFLIKSWLTKLDYPPRPRTQYEFIWSPFNVCIHESYETGQGWDIILTFFGKEEEMSVYSLHAGNKIIFQFQLVVCLWYSMLALYRLQGIVWCMLSLTASLQYSYKDIVSFFLWYLFSIPGKWIIE